MDANLKRYSIRFWSAMAAYMLAVLGAKWALDRVDNVLIQHLLAIAPVVPAMLGAWARVVYVRTQDEVQRAIVAEAAIISFFVVGFGTLTYGFMQDFLDYPTLSLSWVLPALAVSFGLSVFVVRRKYL